MRKFLYNQEMIRKKPKIAIVSLTSCEGCQFALLDLGEKFFDFLKKVELVDMALIEEKPFLEEKIDPVRGKKDLAEAQNKQTSNGVDIAFVEGNPITKENIETLKKIRKQAKTLVVLGNCAALGGIPEMKNYEPKEKTARFLYKKLKETANPEIKELDNFVKVDFTIPGCPITSSEFLRIAGDLVKGKIPEIPQNPVCQECSRRATPECFIVKKEICFGPVSLAGCGAVCPRNGRQCFACRGFLKNVNIKGFVSGLEKNKSREEIDDDLEIFGLRDTLEEK